MRTIMKFIIIFDIDLTLNFDPLLKKGGCIFNERKDFFYVGPELVPDENLTSLDIEHYNLKLRNFYVPSPHFFRLAFEILYENQVDIIIGSGRLTGHHVKEGFAHPDQKPQGIKKIRDQGKINMYDALDRCFGVERPYLLKTTADQLGETFDQINNPIGRIEFSQVKNIFLEIAQVKYRMPANRMILVDDYKDIFEKKAVGEGYQFVHATPNLNHIGEAIFRFVFAEKIQKHIASQLSLQPENEDIMAFAEFIQHYVAEHEAEVCKWQEVLRRNWSVILPVSFASSSFFMGGGENFIIEHRDKNFQIQQAYDQRFGLIVRAF